MTSPNSARLEPMSEEEFQAFLQRQVPRRAAKWVERGIWTEATALEESRRVYDQLLPEGRTTPGNHFLKVVETTRRVPIGEVWYTAVHRGGKQQFWVEWIQIEPDHRRKGFATTVMGILEDLARASGADRVGLTVWEDNPAAARLYAKLGFRSASLNMVKPLAPARKRLATHAFPTASSSRSGASRRRSRPT